MSTASPPSVTASWMRWLRCPMGELRPRDIELLTGLTWRDATPVRYRRGDGTVEQAMALYAWVLGGHTVIVKLRGKAGGVRLQDLSLDLAREDDDAS